MNIETIRNLNHLKNASLVNKECLYINYNKRILRILRLLYKEGVILSFKVIKNNTFIYDQYKIKICLRYLYNKPILRYLTFLSTSSKVSFLSYKDISRLTNKKSLYCLSTSEGILTALDCKRRKLGGVLLFVC